ncbi:MAG: accessory gene regulator B family protein [Clostridia bacterium]|nr:accessory gene regulator B family protein [Clostridia bacterium]
MKKFNVDNLIESILNYFKKHLEIEEDQEAILRYSMQVSISFIANMAMALLVALILGIFPNVLFIMLTISILRSFSGGGHSKTMFGCSIYGTIIMNILGMITKYTYPTKDVLSVLILLTFMFSVWSLHKYAPADTPGKPITTKVKRKKLKTLSFLSLFIWCTICVLWYTGLTNNFMLIYTSTLGILWQSFSLTDWGYALLHHMDRALKTINRTEEETTL